MYGSLPVNTNGGQEGENWAVFAKKRLDTIAESSLRGRDT